jgi:hypothetical protein
MKRWSTSTSSWLPRGTEASVRGRWVRLLLCRSSGRARRTSRAAALGGRNGATCVGDPGNPHLWRDIPQRAGPAARFGRPGMPHSYGSHDCIRVLAAQDPAFARRRLAGAVLAAHGCWVASTPRIPRRTQNSGRAGWHRAVGHGRRCLRRGLLVVGTAILCPREESYSGGEGWAGGNHGCWPLMDRVDDFGVVDLGAVGHCHRHDPWHQAAAVARSVSSSDYWPAGDRVGDQAQAGRRAVLAAKPLAC